MEENIVTEAYIYSGLTEADLFNIGFIVFENIVKNTFLKTFNYF